MELKAGCDKGKTGRYGSFNRTFMELKDAGGAHRQGGGSFNRTFMELKVGSSFFAHTATFRFNRTFMELKDTFRL